MLVEPIQTQAITRALTRVGALVGNTPLYPLERVYQKKNVRLYAKLEWMQMGNSVKARAAYQIIRAAIENDLLNGTRRLLDATSGNTGIAYATIAAGLGVPVTLCLPENASIERKRLLRSLGAELIYTSRLEGTDGAQNDAKELYAQAPDRYYYADQYANPANWQAHYTHTAQEIFHQTGGAITHFVAGLGTTGTFIGTGKRLRELLPDIQLVSLQPDSPMHGLEGWKHLETAIVPKFYTPNLADANLQIDTFEAYEWMRRVAQTEGLLLSPSAAANLAGAVRVAEKLTNGVVVTIFADNADKYGEDLKRVFSA